MKFTRVSAEVVENNGHVCCPVCDKNLVTRHGVVKGINDLWTTNPEVASILKNPDDGYLYTNGSNERVLFVCPTCGNIKLKTIAQVVRYGWFCDACSDGCTYPNKFMANLLLFNKIKYDSEYIIPKYQYRYDFHFIVNNQHYLIEMDGGLNHGCVDLPDLSIEEQIANDSNKDYLAEKFGYKLIRIDCIYKDLKYRFEYIKDHIIKSDLRYLLSDLSDETMSKCNNKASNTNYIMEIANAWNDSIYSLDELSKMFNVCKTTIRNRLKTALEIGLVRESLDDVKHKVFESGIVKRSFAQGTPVLCNETGECFATIADAKRSGFTTISSYLNHKINYAGKLSDGTKLTWKKITKQEFENLQTSL